MTVGIFGLNSTQLSRTPRLSVGELGLNMMGCEQRALGAAAHPHQELHDVSPSPPHPILTPLTLNLRTSAQISEPKTYEPKHKPSEAPKMRGVGGNRRVANQFRDFANQAGRGHLVPFGVPG